MSLLGIGLIVVNRDAITDATQRNVPVDFPFPKLEKVFDNNAYKVYRVPLGHQDASASSDYQSTKE